MKQTTQTAERKPSGPLADAGPYTYDLPVTRGGGQPTPAPQPTWKGAGWSWWEALGLLFLNIGARWLEDVSGWRLISCYGILYAAITVFRYWSKPKPREDFLRWALKVVGIWLNCYIGFVTVPESLVGILPEWLAFGLPAFLIMAALYIVVPVRQDTGEKIPLWQWLLLAMGFAVVWALFGPSLIQ